MTRPSREMATSASVVRSIEHRSEASNTAPRRLEFVSSGQKSRKPSGLSTYMSRIIAPRVRVDSARTVPGEGTSTSYSARPRIFRARWTPALTAGIMDIRLSPRGLAARTRGVGRPEASKSSPGR